MADESKARFSDPAERIAEVLFGLIMVLTFTGSLSVADAGRDDVRTMLIGALGCNIAWGIIDAILYLMDCLSEQAGRIRWLRTLRSAAGAEDAHRVIAESLPPMVADALGPAEYDSIQQKLARLPEPPLYPRLGKDDWLAALSVFVLGICRHVPRGDPIHLHGHPDAGDARFQRHRHRAVVPLWLCVRAYRGL